MKNDLLWLAIGVVVGYLIWQQSQVHHCSCGKKKAGSQPTASAKDNPQTFPPTCGSCGG